MHTEWYEVGGIARDVETIVAHRDDWQAWFVSMLRDYGYIPHLDLTSEWEVSYIEESEQFGWEARVPVCYVGKEYAWEFNGVYEGRLLPARNPTPPSKLGPF